MKEFDFIAIGDIVTDAFIKLSSADIHPNLHPDRKEICMSWGDKIPYDSLEIVPAVGNCANAAVAASRLGLSSALLSNQGDDDVGKQNLNSLAGDNVSVDFIKTHKNIPSNYHFVLSFRGERTILVKHQEYPYEMLDIGNPGWIYLTSLGEQSVDFHHQISEYLENHPKIKLAFQPGTFQIKLGYEILKKIYEKTTLFFCNVEEAKRILNGKVDNDSPKSLSKKIADLGPKITVITDGPNGAYVYIKNQDKYFYMPIYPDIAPPRERTGAGDAFSSTFTIAIAKGFDIETALKWAPISSMLVVQKVGAQAGLPTEPELLKYLSIAPPEYLPREI